MTDTSDFSKSEEYVSFRSNIPLRKIVVDNEPDKGWKLYDSGPKTVRSPLICLPPICGTADIYFKQILSLSAKGFRVISVEAPVYWTVQDWCEGFKKLIDHLELEQVHLFGASLGNLVEVPGTSWKGKWHCTLIYGGFLAQKFAEYTSNCSRVASLILCNSFSDTSVFNYHESSSLFWMLPSLVLKKMIMENFTPSHPDKQIIASVDFMVEKLESLSQQELASRLTLNCINSYVQPQKLDHLQAITVLDVFDEYALSSPVREELYKCYPNAKLAHLKSGGNFPYLSRSDEVNLYLQIHLQRFDETSINARDPPY